MNSIFYNSMYRQIENNRFSKEEIIKRLDIFLKSNRISQEEYDNLIKKINGEI